MTFIAARQVENILWIEAIENCRTQGHLLDWVGKKHNAVKCRRCGHFWRKIHGLGWRLFDPTNEIDPDIPKQLPPKVH